MRQQAIPSSATVAVQRHQVKRCGPNLAWTRAHASSDKEQSMSDRVWEGASAMFLLGGIYFKCKAKFSARDISSIFFNSWFTRELLQLSFSQAARRVMLSIHTCILAFLIEGKKELKALYQALASRALISPSRSILNNNNTLYLKRVARNSYRN